MVASGLLRYRRNHMRMFELSLEFYVYSPESILSLLRVSWELGALRAHFIIFPPAP